MLTLHLNEKELNIKFGYEATLKTKLLSKLSTFEKTNSEGIDGAEMLLSFLPELLLIGLQKFHSNEYGFEYENGKGKKEQEEKMFSIIDDYLDMNEDEDIITLYNALMQELLQNGFLKKQYQKEKTKHQHS